MDNGDFKEHLVNIITLYTTGQVFKINLSTNMLSEAAPRDVSFSTTAKSLVTKVWWSKN